MISMALLANSIGGALLVLFGIWLLGKVYFLWKANQVSYIVLQISPKKNEEKMPSIAEHFFSVLHSIYTKGSWWEQWVKKPQPSIACEMIKSQGSILFWIRIPKTFRSLVEGQLWAHYPESEIIEIDDPWQQLSVSQMPVKWCEMQLENAWIWPIKRFSQFEDAGSKLFHDPLSGLLQPLENGFSENEWGGFHISIRPCDENLFRKKGTQVLEMLALRKFSWGWLQKKHELHQLQIGFWNNIFSFGWSVFFFVVRGKLNTIAKKGVDIQTSKSHEKENSSTAATNKISRFPFETNIRVFVVMEKEKSAYLLPKLRELVAPFKQFSIPHLNSLLPQKVFSDKDLLVQRNTKAHIVSKKNILNTEELATLFHMPHKSVELSDIVWVSNKKIAPPQNLPKNTEESTLTLLGKTNYRGKQHVFGIKPDDRRRHMYIAGKTGMGKSTLLENMIFSDIHNGKGLAVIDPHGDLADAVLQFVPRSRTNDVILFDPADREFPISFNIIECQNPEHKHLVASGVIGVFKKMFAESWGPRLEHILRNALLTLIESGGQSLLGILRILADADYREEILSRVEDPVVLSFWKEEFGKWQPKQVAESISPIQNKVGQFLSSSLVRNILGQTKSSFDLRFAMDKKKIMIINLSKGKIGEDISAMLGAMLVTKFQLDVMSRADTLEKDREDFYLYVDEFQNFATSSFATILSEARKYRLNLTVANQYLSQMEDEVKDAIFGNVGSLMCFQMGYDDAKVVADQFGGEDVILPADIGQLPKYQTYLRLMIDGMPSNVFSVATLPPPAFEVDPERVQIIQKVAREKYAKPRKIVEDRIHKWAWSKRG